MKIGFIADLHLANHRAHGGPMLAGVNQRAQLVLTALQTALELAEQEGCQAFYVAGDFFDTDRPSPQIIAAAQKVLALGRAGLGGRPVQILCGNHDQTSEEPLDNALWALQGFAEVIEQPRAEVVGDLEILSVPFRSGPAHAWLPEVLRAHPPRGAKLRILILHLGMIDEDTPPYLCNAHDAISVTDLEELGQRYRIDRVFAGNWHEHARWELGTADHPFDICQIGTLAPTGWDNAGLGLYGKLVCYDSDTDTLKVLQVPGPRFLKVVDHDGQKMPKLPGDQNSTYVRYVTAPANIPAITQQLQQLVDQKRIAGFEIEPELSEAREDSRRAAAAAKSAGSEQEALEAFVARMPLTAGLDRARISALAQQYLKGS